ncbi:MAG: hypothetical protein IAI50_16140 [Candidatus Eremiobacteraeota bacterium]|nr:hypothetical protein [Candidatus Eremiobacteraeota bacterium]
MLSSRLGALVRNSYFEEYDDSLWEQYEALHRIVCDRGVCPEWCGEARRAIAFITSWQAWIGVNLRVKTFCFKWLALLGHGLPIVLLATFILSRNFTASAALVAIGAATISEILLLVGRFAKFSSFLGMSLFRQTPKTEFYVDFSLAVTGALIFTVAFVDHPHLHPYWSAVITGFALGALNDSIFNGLRSVVFSVWFITGNALLSIKSRQRPQDEITQTLLWIAARVDEYGDDGRPPIKHFDFRTGLSQRTCTVAGSPRCELGAHLSSPEGQAALDGALIRRTKRSKRPKRAVKSATDETQERDLFRYSIVVELAWVADLLEQEIGLAAPAKDPATATWWRKLMQCRANRIRLLKRAFLQTTVQHRDEVVSWLLMEVQHSVVGNWTLLDTLDTADGDPDTGALKKTPLGARIRPLLAIVVLLIAAFGILLVPPSVFPTETTRSISISLIGGVVLSLVSQIDPTHFEKYPSNLSTAAQLLKDKA